jgi:hypothetical protein
VKSFSLFVFLLFLSFNSRSQGVNYPKNQLIGLNSGIGFLLPHRPVMKHLPQSHVRFLELSYAQKLNGLGILGKNLKAWHNNFKNPEVGISLLLTESGNIDILGNGIALLSNIHFNSIEHKQFTLQTTGAIGLGYMTKIYDRIDNPKNNAIGSHFNICAKVGLSANCDIEKWSFRTGLSFLHFSNSAVKIPNLGINLPRFDFGVHYKINTETNKVLAPSGEPKHLWDVLIVGSYGFKDIFPDDGSKYGAYAIQGQLRRRLDKKNMLSFGLDFMYSAAIPAKIEQNSQAQLTNKISYTQNGINIAYNALFNRLTFFFQIGAYLIDKANVDGRIYNRIGGNFNMNGWLLHGGVKTHLGKADHFEVGFGRVLYRSEKEVKPKYD